MPAQVMEDAERRWRAGLRGQPQRGIQPGRPQYQRLDQGRHRAQREQSQFLHHALADDLVHGGLDEGAGDGLPGAVALPVVGDPVGVGPDVGVELTHALASLTCSKVASSPPSSSWNSALMTAWIFGLG